MARKTIAGAAGPLLGMLIPLFIYIYLKRQPALDPSIVVPVHHFVIVSAVALLAAGIAVAVGISGSRLRNIQVIFLSLAFTSQALVFALHGLSTPGFLLPLTRVPAVAAQLSVLLTAFWLLMSVVPSDHPVVVSLSHVQQLLVPVWASVLLLLGIAAMARPDLVGLIPVDAPPLRTFVALLTVAILLAAGVRYWQSHRYSQFPLQLAIVYSAGWLAVVQIILLTGQVWHVSWWLYHFLLLAAMILLVAGLLSQYGTGASLGTAVRGLFTSDPKERLEAGISPSVRALVVATEAHDSYTAGHSFRVALAAVSLGEAMGVSPEQLRALAQGGIVHDVGKIEVPDAVLNKPASLAPEERILVEKHPLTGYEMCKHLGFMKDELDVIRSHHEKWDGTGYPDGLKSEAIPLLARILAIADVYDALTSDRSYRRRWSHEEARRYIQRQAGSHFDPRCVEFWAHLTEEGPLVQEPAPWSAVTAQAIGVRPVKLG
ncbi:MAG TPA: phosphohydrolase [Chloroflexi bacterium]|nr:phosphohydrolase [Chloroflexota bacterium]